jgi:hypothetical protein
MEKNWIIVISLFIIITFLYWKISNGYFKKEVYGKKVFEQWGTRFFYWQGVLFVSGGITVLMIFLLKWINVLTF